MPGGIEELGVPGRMGRPIGSRTEYQPQTRSVAPTWKDGRPFEAKCLTGEDRGDAWTIFESDADRFRGGAALHHRQPPAVHPDYAVGGIASVDLCASLKHGERFQIVRAGVHRAGRL